MVQIYARIVSTLVSLRKDDEGVTAIEYGLIASLIAVAIIASLILVGGKLGTTFTNISNKL